MTATVICPVCSARGLPGMNTYTRADGTFKCRTCGYDSKTTDFVPVEKDPKMDKIIKEE